MTSKLILCDCYKFYFRQKFSSHLCLNARCVPQWYVLITLLQLLIVLFLCFYSVITKVSYAIPVLCYEIKHFRFCVHNGILFHRFLFTQFETTQHQQHKVQFLVLRVSMMQSSKDLLKYNMIQQIKYKLLVKILRSVFFFQSLCGKNLTTILNEYVAMKTKGKPSE